MAGNSVVLNNVNYSGMVAAVFCISSLTHVIIHCNKESTFFPTLFDCQKKSLLPHLEELEATSRIEGIFDKRYGDFVSGDSAVSFVSSSETPRVSFRQ